MTLKPLVQFALLRKYALRYTRRGGEVVQGVFTTKAGEELAFVYEHGGRLVTIGDGAPISINEYGWETNERGEVVFSSKAK